MIATYMTVCSGAKAVHLNMAVAKPPNMGLLAAAYFCLPSSWSSALFKWLYSPQEYEALARTITFLKHDYACSSYRSLHLDATEAVVRLSSACYSGQFSDLRLESQS